MTANPRTVLIVFCAKEGSANFGGIYNAVLSQIAALTSVGVTVIFWGASDTIAAEARKAGAASVFAHPAIHNGIKPLFNSACRRAAREARRQGVRDVIHHSGRTWCWGGVFFPRAKQSQVLHRHRVGSYRFFRNWLALSTGYAAEMREKHGMFGWRRVAYAPNGLRLDLTVPDVPPALPDRGGASLKVVSLGRVGFTKGVFHSKGFDLLVEAAAILKQRGVDIDVEIGGGEDANLDAYAAELGVDDRIHLVGWIGDVAGFLSGGDVFCLPSRIEPFGLVVIEAMAVGRAVVASRTHGPCDIVIDGKTGLLAETGSAEALADALAPLAQDRTRVQEMGVAGHRRVRDDYSLTAVGKSLLSALDSFRR